MSGKIVKTTNALKAAYSCLYGSFMHDPPVSGMPLSLSVELTNHCNLACPECPSGSGSMKRERGYMDVGLYKKILRELNPFLYNINLYFQGEPMMHPDFFAFLQLAGNIYSIAATNGHFLSVGNSERLAMSGLGKLTVSLDGMDQETYSAYRKKGDFEKVALGIKNVAESVRRMHSPLKLEIQFLVNRYNEHQIKNVKKFAAESGARLKLKSMQVINSQDTWKWLPAMERYSRYRKSDGTYKIKNSMPDRCMRLWFNPVITWDGKVLPCCFDKDAEHIMGDITKDDFRTIWNGSAYREFRHRILKGRSTIEICRNCTSGLSLKILH